jgi:hypothetical protein
MSTRKKAGTPNFGIVIFGLLLVIGLIAGGTYALNEAGLLSSGTMPDGAARPDFVSGDATVSKTFTPPEGMPEGRPDEGGSGTFLGFAKAIGQLALVIAPVYYRQKLFGWLKKRLRHRKLTNQTV